MKKNLLVISLFFAISFAGFGQSVGIGTATPTTGRLVIESPAGTSFLVASTGPTGPGLSIGVPSTAPTLGFNLRVQSGGLRFMGTGFGSMFQFNISTGDLNYFPSTASGTAGNSPSLGGSQLTLYPNGNKRFGAYTGFNIVPNPDSGRVAIAHNSTITSPTLQLVEQSTTNYARLEFTNQANNRFWHVAGNNSAVVADDRFNFYHSTAGDIISLRGDGRVGIGSINSHANGYKLSVRGKIICEELRVQLYAAWPDYVFSDNYRLPSLKQVEGFIMQNKHLPGIPAAAQIEKDGLDIGDMQKRMMEKIEELTLYIIEQQKQMDDQQLQIYELSKKNIRKR